MYPEWSDADSSLIDVLRRAGLRRRHLHGLVGAFVSLAMVVGLALFAPSAAYSETAPTPAPTSEPDPTADPTPTPTPTDSPTATESPSPTVEPTPTDTATATPTESPAPSPTTTPTTSPSTTPATLTAPVIESVAVEGSHRVGSPLTALVVATGDPEPTVEYQWQRQATGSPTWSDIPGATADTYVPVQDDLDLVVRVEVTATNTAGSDTAVSLGNEIRGQMSIQQVALVSVSPEQGPLGGGNTVLVSFSLTSPDTSLSGIGFETGPGTGTYNAATIVSQSTTTASVIVPEGTTAGLVGLELRGDRSTGFYDGQYTYVPAPVVTSVSPSSITNLGGTVTLSGTSFTNATSPVNIGGTSAPITSSSATEIVVTVPALTGGQKDITVTALGGSGTGPATLNVIEPSTAQSTVTEDPTTVTVSTGSEFSTLTLQLKDSSGTDITTDGWTVTWSASIPDGTVILGTPVDNQDGTYTVTAASTKAGDATITAFIEGAAVSDQGAVTFQAGSVSAGSSSFSVTPVVATVAAGAGSSDRPVVTVLLRDAFGNPVSGLQGSVTLAFSGGVSGTSTSLAVVEVGSTGSYTTAINSTSPGSVSVSVFVGGSQIGSSQNVTFNAGDADATNSSFSVTPAVATVAADASAAGRPVVTIVLRDALGNPVSGAASVLSLAFSGGVSGTSTSLAVVEVGSTGTYTTAINSTSAGSVSVAVSVNSSQIGSSANVTFQAGPMSPTLSSLEVDPTTVSASTTTGSEVTLTLKDQFGNAITSTSESVTISINGQTLFINGVSGTTGTANSVGDGTYTASVTSTLMQDNLVVRGFVNGAQITQTGSLTITAGPIAPLESVLVASPTQIDADGTATSAITLYIRDTWGNTITFDAVSDLNNPGGANPTVLSVLGTPPGLSLLGDLVYAGNGTYTQILRAGDYDGIARVRAEVNGTVGAAQTTVTLVSVPDLAESTVTASPDSTTVSQTNGITITVQLRDISGDPITNNDDTVTLAVSGDAFVNGTASQGTATAPTGSSTFTATVTNTTAQTVTVTAYVNGQPLTSTNPIQIEFTPGVADGLVIFGGNNQSAVVGSTLRNLQVEVIDAFDNVVPSGTVTWGTASLGTIVPGTATANSQGVATVGAWQIGLGTQSLDVYLSGTSTKVTFTANGFSPPSPPAPSTGGGADAAITEMRPASGPLSGGNTVLIIGYGFSGVGAVTIGGQPVTSYTVIDAATIQVVVPAGTALGSADVVVSLASGRAVAPGGYVYVADPADPAGGDEIIPLQPGISTPTPGSVVSTLSGQPESLNVRANQSRDGLLIGGQGWNLSVEGIEFGGDAAALADPQILRLQKGQRVSIAGSGYLPNSLISVYASGPETFLGTIRVGADGSFEGSLPVPNNLDVGEGTLQVDGFTPAGQVRSVDIGVRIRDAAMTEGTELKRRILFAVGSSQLTDADKAKLEALLAEIPRGAKVSTLFRGYAGKNASDPDRAATIARNRARNTAEYMVDNGLRGEVYTSGMGKSEVAGKKGRKVVIQVTYQVRSRSIDFDPSELKMLMLR